MTPQIYFSIGAARSGKSTYSKRWSNGCEMIDVQSYNRVVWNQDNFRLAMGGQRFNKVLEPLVHTFKSYAIKSLLLGDYIVFVDGTHTTERSITDLLRLDINAQPVLFDTPEYECWERALATEQPDLLPVITHHCNNIAKLKAEGLDNVMARLRREVVEYDEYRWRKS